MKRSSKILPKVDLPKKGISFNFKKIYPIFSFIFIILLFVVAFNLVKVENKDDLVMGKSSTFKDLLPTPALYPVNKNISSPPETTATSIKIIDLDSMAVLFEKNSKQRIFPASTTKIMTALIVLEQYPLKQILTVGQTKVEGSILNLIPGDQITVENLLYGLLVASGNDAAQIFAENFPGGVEGFVWVMNQKAKDLTLENTHFTNPAGLDAEGHYSTAEDLTKLAAFAVKNEEFAKIVSTPEYTITDVSGTKTYSFKNTNELVGEISEIKGIKTGWTENAGECLVSLLERNGAKIVIALFGSTDRFGETRQIIDWIFTNFQWQRFTVQPIRR